MRIRNDEMKLKDAEQSVGLDEGGRIDGGIGPVTSKLKDDGLPKCSLKTCFGCGKLAIALRTKGRII